MRPDPQRRQRFVNRARGSPVLAGLTVDGDRQLPAEAHQDLRAVGNGLVQGRHNQVTVGDGDALLGERVSDGRAKDVDRGLLALDGQRHGLVERGRSGAKRSQGYSHAASGDPSAK